MRKQELIQIVLTVLLCAGLVFGIGVGSYFYFRSLYTRSYVSETKWTEPEPLVIDIPEEVAVGTLTVLDSDGAHYFQYYGAIDILHDGSDGEEIEIEIQLPESSN